MTTDNLLYHPLGEGKESLAYRLLPRAPTNTLPGFMWLGGFLSDMDGTKALAMESECRSLGTSSLRFDYSGHGLSGGQFKNGCISDWTANALEILLSHTDSPTILVGSSMGGWIALRLIEELRKRNEHDRICGLLLIAPAPDFTSELMEPSFTDDERAELERNGYISQPSEYSDEPTIITRRLLEDGANNLVLRGNLTVGVPVHILQGMDDPDVPWEHALRLVDCLMSDDVTVTLVKGGDHRLSRDQDIDLLRRTMRRMATPA